MTKQHDLQVGDVVQIDPEHDNRFGGCFMQITEVKSWGVQGFVKTPGQGDAYYRCEYEQMHKIGAAEWMHADAPDEDR